VAASFQTPTLFLIAQDLTKMQVDTNVSESDVGKVAEGQPAAFTVDAYPGRPFRGTVAQVRNAPITVQNVVTYDVVITVPNPDLALKPGMTATVSITTARRDHVLRVPLRALRFRPENAPAAGHGSPAVWVEAPNGALRPVEVRTGVRDEQWAEVVAGALHEGDRVVTGLSRRGTTEATASPPHFPHHL
jgi:HlyD family secretion protein